MITDARHILQRKKHASIADKKIGFFCRRGEKERKKVLHLNIGQPDIKTPTVALEAIKNIGLDVLEYTPSRGTPEFRSKLAKYYATQNRGKC